MKIPYPDETLTRVEFMEPNTDGYLVLGAEVDRRPAWLPGSRRKKQLLGRLTALARRAESAEFVKEVVVFDAKFFAPIPVGGKRLRQRVLAEGKKVDVRPDVVVLARTAGPEAAEKLAEEPTYGDLVDEVRRAASAMTMFTASNVRRVGDVAHDGRALFLFNFFYSQDGEMTMPVWEHSARWFAAHTRLTNSTVLAPLAGQPTDFDVVNHASWPHWHTVLPHVVFRRSFHRYVNANTIANGVGSRPGLYRQVHG